MTDFSKSHVFPVHMEIVGTKKKEKKEKKNTNLSMSHVQKSVHITHTCTHKIHVTELQWQHIYIRNDIKNVKDMNCCFGSH